jgi:hypothetical protein
MQEQEITVPTKPELEGSCHCGRVTWTLKAIPESATACNCTSCRRWGGLWAYGVENEDIIATGLTKTYIRGTNLEYHFCTNCGCVTHWRTLDPADSGKRAMAVNLRMTDPEKVFHLQIDHFDGLDSFEDLPRDARCIRDYWF